MTVLDDWTAGTPIKATIPLSAYPIVTLVTVAAGLFTAGNFVIQSKNTPLVQQLQTAILASILLGFGAVFASNAAGVYL